MSEISTKEGFHYQFIHNVFGCFMADTLDYFGSYLYPRFEHKLISGYHKAVEYIREQDALGREQDKPNLPALIINPSGDFGLDDANSGAKQLWRFPGHAGNYVSNLYDPIYQDNNMKVTPGFTRLKGEFELLVLVDSFYEFFDLKLFLIQLFGGEGRHINPRNFNYFIILPEELINFKYANSYTEENHGIDWDSVGAYEYLVQTTNKNELVYPGQTNPQYILRGMSDGSTKAGGLEDLSDWRLSATIEYQIEIPSFLIVETDYVLENINFDIRFGSAYTEHDDYNIPINRNTFDTSWESGLDEDEHSEFDIPDEAEIINREDVVLKNRYFHVVTQLQDEQFDVDEDVIITLPETVDDKLKLIVNSKYGELDYGDHYTLQNEGTELKIKGKNVDFKLGDILELFIYQDI